MIKKFESFKLEPKVDIKYYDNGQKKSEKWYLKDKYHRKDGPAFQTWFENGQKDIEIWYLNGKAHMIYGNIPKPAYQNWFENGQKEYEIWYLNGNRHREDGPAVQEWFDNGQKGREYWYLNGLNYPKEKWIDELKRIGSIHYEEQKMLFDFEKYNI